MDELMLLTDGSVNTQSNIGYGAYLAVSERGLSLDLLRTRVKVRRFDIRLQQNWNCRHYYGRSAIFKPWGVR